MFGKKNKQQQQQQQQQQPEINPAVRRMMVEFYRPKSGSKAVSDAMDHMGTGESVVLQVWDKAPWEGGSPIQLMRLQLTDERWSVKAPLGVESLFSGSNWSVTMIDEAEDWSTVRVAARIMEVVGSGWVRVVEDAR